MKVRLQAEEFELVLNVDISPERYSSMMLKQGEVVYVSPKQARIFPIDYSI